MSKGQLLNWVFALVMTFAVVVMWLVAVKVFVPVQSVSEPLINATNSSVGSRGLVTIGRVVKFNIVWPVLVIVGIWLWALLSSLRRDPNVEYR
jgi:hypothetical protein